MNLEDFLNKVDEFDVDLLLGKIIIFKEKEKYSVSSIKWETFNCGEQIKLRVILHAESYWHQNRWDNLEKKNVPTLGFLLQALRKMNEELNQKRFLNEVYVKIFEDNIKLVKMPCIRKNNVEHITLDLGD